MCRTSVRHKTRGSVYCEITSMNHNLSQRLYLIRKMIPRKKTKKKLDHTDNTVKVKQNHRSHNQYRRGKTKSLVVQTIPSW